MAEDVDKIADDSIPSATFEAGLPSDKTRFPAFSLDNFLAVGLPELQAVDNGKIPRSGFDLQRLCRRVVRHQYLPQVYSPPAARYGPAMS